MNMVCSELEFAEGLVGMRRVDFGLSIFVPHVFAGNVDQALKRIG